LGCGEPVRRFATKLENADGLQVSTVEHLWRRWPVAGNAINALSDPDGPEVRSLTGLPRPSCVVSCSAVCDAGGPVRAI